LADEQYIEGLMAARGSLVRERRDLAKQMESGPAAANAVAKAFSNIQDAIEAVDKAMEDERRIAKPAYDPVKTV
jgi:hypothetical protein